VVLEVVSRLLARADDDSFDEHADECGMAVLAVVLEEPGEGFGVVDEGLYGNAFEDKGLAVGIGEGRVQDYEVDVGGRGALTAHEGARDEGGICVGVMGCEDLGGKREYFVRCGQGSGHDSWCHGWSSSRATMNTGVCPKQTTSGSGRDDQCMGKLGMTVDDLQNEQRGQVTRFWCRLGL